MLKKLPVALLASLIVTILFAVGVQAQVIPGQNQVTSSPFGGLVYSSSSSPTAKLGQLLGTAAGNVVLWDGSKWTAVATSSLGITGGSGSSTAAGPTNAVQYNAGGGVFGGSAGFVFNGTNVGIGTTTPNTRLTVTSSGPNGISLDTDTSDPTSSGRLFFSNGTTTNGVSIVNSSGALSLRTTASAGTSSGIEALRIVQSGNVGINASVPDYRLSISTTSVTNADLESLETTGVQTVGQGTSLIFRNRTLGTGGAGNAVRIGSVTENATGGTRATGFAISTDNQASGGLREIARFSALGNLGIGTTTPGNRLTVIGTTTADCFSITGSGTCLTSGGGGTGSISTSTPLVSGRVVFSTGSNTVGNDSNFLWDNSQKFLGIGKTPATTLDVNGQGSFNGIGTGIGLYTTGSGAGILAENSASGGVSGLFNQFNANGYGIDINSSGIGLGVESASKNYLFGNTGIGTSTPSQLLTVAGNALITGTTTSSCFSTNGTTCITGGGGTNYFNLIGNALQNNVGTQLGINTAPNLASFEVMGSSTLATDNVMTLWNSASTSVFNVANNGETTITGSSSKLFTVGSTTAPAFQINTSGGVGTGLVLSTAATSSGVTLTATSSNSFENLILNAKTSGFVQINSGTLPGSILIGNGQTSPVTLGGRYVFNQANFSAILLVSSSNAALVRWNVQNTNDTSLTAGVEAPFAYWNMGAAVRQHASNTSIPLQRDFRLTGTTHSFATAGGVINQDGVLAIDNPGSGGTNATITNASGLLIGSSSQPAVANVTNAFGMQIWAPTGATNNFAASTTGYWAMNGLPAAGAGNTVLCISASSTIILGSGASGCSPSSERYKEDIASSSIGLAEVRALDPVSYKYKSGDTRTWLGLIAEQVENIIPEAVIHDNTGQISGIEWNMLWAPVINSIKELAKHDDEQDVQIAELQKQVQELTSKCVMKK